MTAKGRKAVSSKKAPAKKPPVELDSVGGVRPDEMTEEVLAFITAIDDYKRRSGQRFPTWSAVLEVLKGLGYERRAGGGFKGSPAPPGS